MSAVEKSVLAMIVFLIAVFTVVTVEKIMLVGECGLGPAADATCTWDETR